MMLESFGTCFSRVGAMHPRRVQSPIFNAFNSPRGFLWCSQFRNGRTVFSSLEYNTKAKCTRTTFRSCSSVSPCRRRHREVLRTFAKRVLLHCTWYTLESDRISLKMNCCTCFCLVTVRTITLVRIVDTCSSILCCY